ASAEAEYQELSPAGRTAYDAERGGGGGDHAEAMEAAREARPTKQCPECAETVLADANVCRYCGHRFGAVGGDLDGARLVALNMALNGESRAATERYLAEHFQLHECDKLIDEVYAAIEA